MKKLLAIMALVALVAAGASAQLMFGVVGDLHMDTQMSSSDIAKAFQDGQNIFYGPFAELALGKLGFGVAGTFSVYTDYWDYKEKMAMDVAGYLSWHFWKARAFLDPFVELGGGYMGLDFVNAADKDPMLAENPIAANMYWYGAAGLGLNLGAIGVFGKMTFNSAIQQKLKGTDANGLEYDIDYYMVDVNDVTKAYIPPYRFTIGAKFIL